MLIMMRTSSAVIYFLAYFLYFCHSYSTDSTFEDHGDMTPEDFIITKSMEDNQFSDFELLKLAIEKVLKSGPNLIKSISELEKTDFLTQYKLGEKNEDVNLNITGLAEKYGYHLEMYQIQTEDGYIISAFRIPSKGEPVLLVHGILSSAVDWFTIGQNVAFPYLLADLGYDVWLLNARGSIDASRGHVSLSSEKHSEEYWDFSWEEIGRYDLPATIDFVLETTGRKKLRYVGHSQGTTSFFVMASERPEYNEKVSLAVAFSPIAWMSHMFSPLVRILAVFGDKFSYLLRQVIGFNAFEAKNPLVQFLTQVICGNSVGATLVCGNLIFAISGFDYDQVNVTQMPVILKHTPGTVSTKQLIHYAQEVNSGKFRSYDYGPSKNLAKYGTAVPPDYPVDKITAPVALFYRQNSDWLSAYEDVLILKSKLPNVVEFYEVPHDDWCHTDYLWAKGARDLVYDKTIELFKRNKI